MWVNIINKKMSWQRFFGRLAVFMVFASAATFYISQNYQFSFDPQTEKSTGHRLFVIDVNDRELVRGDLYAFQARGLEPLFDDGTRMVKYLRAFPGDEVEVNRNSVFVNGEAVTNIGARDVPLLGKKREDFFNKGKLKEGQLWFLGSSPGSFDSRYWGAVGEDQVIGKAYGFF